MDPFTAMPGTRLRKCPICSRFYEPNNSRSLGCSDACRAENRKRKHRDRQREARRAGKPPRTEYHRQYDKNRTWPTCGTCGVIARKLRDIGCLECYARSQPVQGWSPLELDMLEIHTGREDLPRLQMTLYRTTGVARTRTAIRRKRVKQAIRTSSNQMGNGYTITQLSEITGRPYGTIHSLIDEGFIKNIGKGRCILISLKDGERVINRYLGTDPPYYTRAEAAAILGCHVHSIDNAVSRGLPSWRVGFERRICKAAVDRAVAYLRETGNIRINWRRLMQSTEQRVG